MFNVLLAGGLIVALVGLMMDVQTRSPSPPDVKPFSSCNNDIQADVALSRQQLAHLLAIPERDSKDKIRDMVETPYCTLPTVEVRSGVNATREVYPLAFAPQTWLILLFEGNEYAGYRIAVQP